MVGCFCASTVDTRLAQDPTERAQIQALSDSLNKDMGSVLDCKQSPQMVLQTLRAPPRHLFAFLSPLPSHGPCRQGVDGQDGKDPRVVYQDAD